MSIRLRENSVGTPTFPGLHVWDTPRIAERDTRDWRDTRNQGLRVAFVALGVPVARLRGWRTVSASCYAFIFPKTPSGV